MGSNAQQNFDIVVHHLCPAGGSSLVRWLNLDTKQCPPPQPGLLVSQVAQVKRQRAAARTAVSTLNGSEPPECSVSTASHAESKHARSLVQPCELAAFMSCLPSSTKK